MFSKGLSIFFFFFFQTLFGWKKGCGGAALGGTTEIWKHTRPPASVSSQTSPPAASCFASVLHRSKILLSPGGALRVGILHRAFVCSVLKGARSGKPLDLLAPLTRSLTWRDPSGVTHILSCVKLLIGSVNAWSWHIASINTNNASKTNDHANRKDPAELSWNSPGWTKHRLVKEPQLVSVE